MNIIITQQITIFTMVPILSLSKLSMKCTHDSILELWHIEKIKYQISKIQIIPFCYGLLILMPLETTISQTTSKTKDWFNLY